MGRIIHYVCGGNIVTSYDTHHVYIYTFICSIKSTKTTSMTILSSLSFKH